MRQAAAPRAHGGGAAAEAGEPDKNVRGRGGCGRRRRRGSLRRRERVGRTERVRSDAAQCRHDDVHAGVHAALGCEARACGERAQVRARTGLGVRVLSLRKRVRETDEGEAHARMPHLRQRGEARRLHARCAHGSGRRFGPCEPGRVACGQGLRGRVEAQRLRADRVPVLQREKVAGACEGCRRGRVPGRCEGCVNCGSDERNQRERRRRRRNGPVTDLGVDVAQHLRRDAQAMADLVAVVGVVAHEGLLTHAPVPADVRVVQVCVEHDHRKGQQVGGVDRGEQRALAAARVCDAREGVEDAVDLLRLARKAEGAQVGAQRRDKAPARDVIHVGGHVGAPLGVVIGRVARAQVLTDGHGVKASRAAKVAQQRRHGQVQAAGILRLRLRRHRHRRRRRSHRGRGRWREHGRGRRCKLQLVRLRQKSRHRRGSRCKRRC